MKQEYSEYKSKKLISLPFSTRETDYGSIYFASKPTTFHVDQRLAETYIYIGDESMSFSPSSSSSWHLNQSCIIKGRNKLFLNDKMTFEDGNGDEYILKSTAFSGYKFKRENRQIAKIKKQFSFTKRKYKIEINDEAKTRIIINAKKSDRQYSMYRGGNVVAKVYYDGLKPSRSSSAASSTSSCLLGDYFVEVFPGEDIILALNIAIIFERHRQLNQQQSSSYNSGAYGGAFVMGLGAGAGAGGCGGGCGC